jgi:ABC-type uncharacterized transport system ATPase subunit/ABC-type uncharacterized transport system permease subunit
MSTPAAVAGTEGKRPRLELHGIRKVYPSVVANDGIDLTVLPGEIHAVLGENGAGKSTLMKIIYGVTQQTAGEMVWEGQPVTPENPAQARSLGIGMVFQHFSLFETLTVVENVALALPGAPDLGDLARRIEKVSEKYGLPVDPRRLVHALSVGERQRVEIIRCLLQTPKLLIMDEPTSVLTPQAVRKLFETLRQLAAEGCSILYISHKLDEIQELCHTATVLRGGKVTGHCVPSQETPKTMARLMIGKDLPVCEHSQAKEGGEIRLRLAGLSHASDDPFGTDLKDMNLDVHSGEIVGIAGVSGNGQQELLYAISGEGPLAEKFPVQICGTEAGRMMPGRRRKAGLCFVPEERLGRGAGAQHVARRERDSHRREDARLRPRRPARLRGGARIRHGLHPPLQREMRRAASTGALALRRQSAEVHRGPRSDAGAEGACRRAAHLGRRRRRCRIHPAIDHRPTQRRMRRARDLRRAGRAIRDLRPHRGHREGAALAGEADERYQRRGDRRLDERHVAGGRGRRCHRGRAPVFRLETRPEASEAMRYWSPAIAVALTLAGGLIVFAALGKNPVEGFRVFFLSPMRDLNAVAELLLKATPLMLIAVGLAVGFRANVWNIGAEGQFLMGAVGATGVALAFKGASAAVLLPSMIVAGAIGGALWAAIPALLKTKFNANEILTSLMLVYIAQLGVSWLVFGPWKDPAGFNFPQTEMFEDAALLPMLIEGTRLNLAFLVALAALAAGYVFMAKSFIGFKMRVAGESEAAARYAGFSAVAMVWIGMFVGGAAAGIAGMAEVAGPAGQLTDKLSSGYGFAAIIVAFVGRLNPIGIFFASLLMALFFIGGEQAQQYLNLPSSISKVFQGMLLFFLLGSDVLIQYRVRRVARARQAT